MNKKEYAVALKHGGHNCAQAVLCAYAADMGISELEMNRLGAGFGVGMGCMEATCGALCAAEILLGLKEFSGRPILRQAAMLHNSFTQKCGATICKELKGMTTGTVLCDCDDCIRGAVEAFEELM